MSNRVVVLGSGAAPGVPCLSRGWGDCNSENPKKCGKSITVQMFPRRLSIPIKLPLAPGTEVIAGVSITSLILKTFNPLF